MISLIIGVAIKPCIDIAAIAISPIIKLGLRVSVSPIIATLNITYYMIIEYVKQTLTHY
ncbi:MAG: hypothetical protein QXJ65_05150 [Acidilobaceae archaeon]